MSTTQPTTLRSLAMAPSTPPTLEHSALIVIDAQQEYAAHGRLPLSDLAGALHAIETLLAEARTVGAPVIHVAHVGAARGLFDPDGGGGFLDAAAPVGDEAIVRKSLPNSFAGTDLDQQLGALAITDLTLVGFMTHMCVSSTARAALDLGYRTSIVADATATRDLPGTNGRALVPASVVHEAALAALADRFSVVTNTSHVLPSSYPSERTPA